jgi:hypothetical protein
MLVFASTLAVAGCARDQARRDLHSPRHEVGAGPVHTSARIHDHFQQRRHAGLQIRLPDAALLAPQPAPDCEFKGTKVEAMDATELTRLKIEYERQCYQNAEKAARDRLSSLQGALQHSRY